MRRVRRRAVAVRWWHLMGAWITCHTQANHIVVMHAGSSTVTPVAKADSWLSCTTKSSFCGDDLRLVRHSLSSWCTKRRMEDWRKVRPNIVQSQWCYCSAWIDTSLASLSKTAVMKYSSWGLNTGIHNRDYILESNYARWEIRELLARWFDERSLEKLLASDIARGLWQSTLTHRSAKIYF